MKLYEISGKLSLFFGIASCTFIILGAIKPNSLYLMFSLINTILGFVFSIINIYLNAKYEIEKKKFTLGFGGLILSSVPVIFLMLMIFNK